MYLRDTILKQFKIECEIVNNLPPQKLFKEPSNSTVVITIIHLKDKEKEAACLECRVQCDKYLSRGKPVFAPIQSRKIHYNEIPYNEIPPNQLYLYCKHYDPVTALSKEIIDES